MTDEPYSTPKTLAEQLWQHLGSLFGVDALKRKYGLTPPMAWTSALSHLSPRQLRHGIDRLTNSGSAQIPSLPQFLAMCRDAREFEPGFDAPRIDGPKFDAWAVAANHHFMAYVWGHAKGWTEEHTRIFVQYKNAWADDCRALGNSVPVDQQKAMWADCMARAEAATGRSSAPSPLGRRA